MFTIKVNGTSHQLDVEEDTPLLWVLREEIGLTGTKFGCGIAACGACTVHFNGEAMRSCAVLLGSVDGAEITTIQGLGNGNGALHPLQQAFHEEHALQCGYCTPGMIMAAADLLRDNPHPTEQEVRDGLEGNLCRCTGYQNIVRAVLKAADSAEVTA